MQNFILKSYGDVANLIFNSDDKVNKLTEKSLIELNDILDRINKYQNVKILVIKSGKEDNFIAGADINEIINIKTKDEAFVKAKKGQDVMNKIANLQCITIAMIEGACLGGGLELAIACDYRLLVEKPKSILGLPEVKLGIIPGFGGTQRLPRLVGLTKAIEMIATGKSLNARESFKIGLVDKILNPSFKEKGLGDFIKKISDKKIAKKKDSFLKKILEFMLKNIIISVLRKRIFKRTKGHYQAPLSALEVIRKTYPFTTNKGFKIEAKEFSKLSLDKNLLNLFLISESFKKDNFSLEKFNNQKIDFAAILGAGPMGGGIAWLFSVNEIRVRIKDISQSFVSEAFKKILKINKSSNKKYSRNKLNLAFNRISSSLEYESFAKADIIIEAVTEDIETKKTVIRECEKYLNKNTIIASNTSSLSISEISNSLNNPDRFVGMHFFNPVNKMHLVEVIKGEKTANDVIYRVVSLAKRLKKFPLLVKDAPGFFINRILLPYINEAGFLLEDGVSVQRIDRILENFGMPMGPFTLLDKVGLDVGYKVAKTLFDAFGERMKINSTLENIRNDSRTILGVKSQEGFYIYDKNEKKLSINKRFENKNNTDLNDDEIYNRCIFIMINEATRCLEEAVINDVKYADFSTIIGIGFPAFRGGVFKYADQVGIEVIINSLKKYENKYGSRFSPSNLLLKMKNKKFYS